MATNTTLHKLVTKSLSEIILKLGLKYDFAKKSPNSDPQEEAYLSEDCLSEQDNDEDYKPDKCCSVL